MWQLIMAMAIWGTLGLFVLKSGLGSIDIAFFRCLIGAVILVPYCGYKGFFSSKILTVNIIVPVIFGGIFGFCRKSIHKRYADLFYHENPFLSIYFNQ